eukprot:2396689-Rhodomonas_salina.2
MPNRVSGRLSDTPGHGTRRTPLCGTTERRRTFRIAIDPCIFNHSESAKVNVRLDSELTTLFGFVL